MGCAKSFGFVRMLTHGGSGGWLACYKARACENAGGTAWRGNDDWGVLLANAGGTACSTKRQICGVISRRLDARLVFRGRTILLWCCLLASLARRRRGL